MHVYCVCVLCCAHNAYNVPFCCVLGHNNVVVVVVEGRGFDDNVRWWANDADGVASSNVNVQCINLRS